MNIQALRDADEEFYRRHAGDARLFDAAGNRKPLSLNDPLQAALRREWLQIYEKKGGKLEKPPSSEKRGSAPVEPCPQPPAHLIVSVRYTPQDGPVAKAVVTIEGPVSAQLETDASGIADFGFIPPGGYAVEARLESGNALATAALGHVGETGWAYNTASATYPAGTNKCNDFVASMAGEASYPVPMMSRFSLSQRRTVTYPPLAGDWANAGKTLTGWVVVSDPQPGDIIAEAHNYSDATGHVGIVGYPEPSGLSTALPPGAEQTLTIELQRRTISAGSDDVLNNDWGWRPGQAPTFRRFTP